MNPGVLFGKREEKLFLEGIRLFNDRKFWEAHETFEDVWRAQKGDAKKLVQGFVQAAAALSYIAKRRYESILYLLDKSVEKLSAMKDFLPGLEISSLIDSLRRIKEEVRQIGEEGLGRFDPSGYPVIKSRRRPARSKRRPTAS